VPATTSVDPLTMFEAKITGALKGGVGEIKSHTIDAILAYQLDSLVVPWPFAEAYFSYSDHERNSI